MALNLIIRKNGTLLFNLSGGNDLVRRLDEYLVGTEEWKPLTRDILDSLDRELGNDIDFERECRNKYRSLIGANINAETASEIAESISDAEDNIEELRDLQGQLNVLYWLLSDVYDEDEEKIKAVVEYKRT